MRTLGIDIETFSSIEISKSGMYKYVESPDFEILLFAYRFDDEPVRCIDLTDLAEIPHEVKKALVDPYVIKTAWNASFERTSLQKHLGVLLPINQWRCTMAHASMLGLPLALGQAADALKMPLGKMTEGKALIKYFCVPCKPTKANGGRTRNLPEHAPEKWEAFKNYCIRDVEVESNIKQKVKFFRIPEQEQALYVLDQEINDRGLLLDPVLVRSAIKMDLQYKDQLTEKAVAITGLSNPNSVAQLKTWLSAEMGKEVSGLTKKDIPVLIRDADEMADADAVRQILRLRQELSKTSVKKYMAMHKAVCSDNRVRGLLQYYGANRTGRWAGRLVQLQNLPQNHLSDLAFARDEVRSGDLDSVQILWGSASDVLKQLIRTAFIADKNHRLIAADFSAIEARVIAWLANEPWRLQVFKTHGKIYEASAAQMFRVPIESVTKGSDLRQKGKVAELALGYQGGPNALISMGALDMGIAEEELPKLVKMWRNANPNIVKLWDKVNEAAIEAVSSGVPQYIGLNIYFRVSKGYLFIDLPSGRSLSYSNPKLKPGKYGDQLTYDGMDQTTKKWCSQVTYGGKLVENIVQAIARDCLADAMIRINAAGYTIVGHVHDEVILEMPVGKGSCEEVNKIMGTPIPWAKGLPLKADSYETFFYRKD